MKTLIVLAVVVVGCSPGMSAKDACEKLKSEGFGTECTKDEPGGLGKAAREKYDLALEEPKGKACQVLEFKTKGDLDAAVKAFEAASAIAGPHRYAAGKSLLFVQCNDKMPRELGDKLEKALADM